MNESAFKLKPMRKAVIPSIVIITLLVGVAALNTFGTKAPSVGAYCPPTLQPILAKTPSGFETFTGMCAKLTATITHQEHLFASPQLLQSGFTPSCYAFCFGGITYTEDPTIVVNRGRDFEQCKTFGASGTITCTAADFATIMGVSTSATAPAATDSACASIITTGGLTDIAGTVTAGAAGATVTTTITHTWTAAETDTAVQLACLTTEVHGGANIVLYAEGTFGPDTLVSGNTLQITWSIART